MYHEIDIYRVLLLCIIEEYFDKKQVLELRAPFPGRQ